MNRLTRSLPWLLLLASASLFFLPLGARALWSPDEGSFAEIARGMLELGEWIGPQPPLLYWLTAFSLALFGQNEFAARFWCAVFGLLTVGVVYRLGKAWKNDNTGLLAGSCLATSLGFFAFTQFLAVDIAFTFWMTFALYASARMVSERPPDRVKRFTDLLAIGIAAGILTQGFIAMVLPVMTLALTLAYTRMGGQARKIPWQSALLLMLLLAAPWFVLLSLKDPSAPLNFFIREPASRFLAAAQHPAAPVYFFVPVIIGGFLPWSVFLPQVFRAAFEHHGVAMKRDPVKALLVIWTLFVAVLFTLSPSKRLGDVLPVLPALALLVGNAFEEALDEESMPRWIERGVIGLSCLLIAGLCVLKLPPSAGLFEGPLAQAMRAQADPLAFMLGLSVFVLVGVWGMRQSILCMGGILIVQVILLTLIACSLHAEETPQSLLGLTTSQADLVLVDPDLSQTPLPKLVLPPEPPAHVRLADVIVKKDEWKGVQCAVREPRFAVFRHADKWASFWERALAPYSPRLAKTPAVDFDKDIVIGVFLGEKPYPHYEIEIRSIRLENKPDQGKVLVVRYREDKRMMGVFLPPFAIQPFHLKKVPAFAGEVTFLKVKR